MARQQHCMEIKTLKRDIAECSTDGDRYRMTFKSPNGASKFSILMTEDQALRLIECFGNEQARIRFEGR